MKQYIALLNSEPVLKKLSLIQLIAYFGAWFSNIAIYTLLIYLKVSAEIIAFVAMLHFLSGVIQAPLTGAIIDKFETKKIMIFMLLIQIFSTLGLLVINSVGQLLVLYCLIFIKMAAASFYFTAEMSLLPRILDRNILQTANELHSIIWSFSYTFGMALSGYFVYLFGIKSAFLLDAFLFVIAFFILLTTPINVMIQERSQNLFLMMLDTFKYLKQEIKVFHLMFIHAFVGFTAFDALVALLVDKYYHSVLATSLSLGLLHSFRAFGLVIGSVFLSKWINRKNLIKLFFLEATAMFVWSFLMHNFYLSLFASILVGFFVTTLWSYTYTLIQKNMDEKYYGRIVAYNDMLFLSIAAFTSYMTGFLVEMHWKLESIGFLIGITFIIGGIYYFIIYTKYQIKG